MRSNPPAGWSICDLMSIADVRTGKKNANHESVEGKYRFYTCAYNPLKCDTYSFQGECLVLPGNGANVGEVFYYNGKFEAYQRTYVIENIKIVPQYLYYHLLSNWRDINRKKQYGSATNYIKIGNFEDYSVLVPPKNEQRRIAEKIEALQSKSDKAKKSLETAEPLLDKLRHSILESAFRGDLTADWRKNNSDVEPASVLLERIRAKRRKKWEENELAKMRASGKEPKNDKWKLKYKEPEPVVTKGLPKLPDEWCWARLEEVSILKGGLTKGKKRKKTDVLKSVPYLRVANVQRGFLDLKEVSSIEATEIELLDLKLQHGDILFNEGGDLDKLGRGWVWKNEIEECIHQNHVFRSRLVSENLIPELISHFGNSFGQQWFMREGKQTTNLASLNLTKLSNFPVPIIPIEEGKVLFKKINLLLNRLGFLQNESHASLKRLNTLYQGILNKAFEGNLVPQDPSDEDATALLERIKVEQGKKTQKKKRKKKV